MFKVRRGDDERRPRLYLAKQDVAGYEAYAEQLAVMFKVNRKLLEDVLEGLFHIAKADRVLHPKEELFLAQVARRFGLAENEFATSRRATRLPRSATPTTC